MPITNRIKEKNQPGPADPESAGAMPIVSVVIPVYNGAEYLIDALESVFSQSMTQFEVIVVDDGSTDDTLLILEAFADRIQILRQNNAGHAAARNAAIRVAKGQWIAMLDADDIWHAGKLEEQLAAADSADVVYTAARNFEDAGRVADVTFQNSTCPRGDIFRELLIDNFITHSSVLIRKDALIAVGGYETTLKTTCDWDLWLRMSAAGSLFVGLEQPLTHYRWRANSWSRNHNRTCKDRLHVVRSAMNTKKGQALPPLFRQTVLARAWQTSAWFVAEKDDRMALTWYLKSICHRPYSIRGWKEITRCLLHLCGISRKRLWSLACRLRQQGGEHSAVVTPHQ